MCHVSQDKTTGQPALRSANGRIISRHATQGEAVRARDEMLRQPGAPRARTKTTQGRNKHL